MDLLRVAWRTVGSIVTRVNADGDRAARAKPQVSDPDEFSAPTGDGGGIDLSAQIRRAPRAEKSHAGRGGVAAGFSCLAED